MMNDSSNLSGSDTTPVQTLTNHYVKVQRQYQQILDRWTPFVLKRWLATAGLLALFMLRIVLAQGVRLSLFLLSFLHMADGLHSGISVSPCALL